MQKRTDPFLKAGNLKRTSQNSPEDHVSGQRAGKKMSRRANKSWPQKENEIAPGKT